MDMNTYVMIGVAVVSLFFGYFFGLFEGRGQGYKKRKKEEEEGQAAEASADEVEAGDTPQPDDQPEPPEMPEETGLMRLSQAPDGSLQLDLDGARVNTEALTRDQRGRLIALLSAMRPWLEPGRSPRPAPAPVQPAPSQPEAAPPPAVTVESPAAPMAEEPAAADEPVTEPKSIVSQIDSILQLRIAGTPLHEKGIKLQESPEGGVLVWVGLNKYQTVDEVPDEAIKTAIRAAIVEWEDKYTPSG
jgi:hypothetical protein